MQRFPLLPVFWVPVSVLRLQVGTAHHPVDGAVRLLDGGVLHLGTEVCLHVLQILLPQRLLLCLFCLSEPAVFAFMCQLVDAGDLFLGHRSSCIFPQSVL